jgi:hypothetical protein
MILTSTCGWRIMPIYYRCGKDTRGRDMSRCNVTTNSGSSQYLEYRTTSIKHQRKQTHPTIVLRDVEVYNIGDSEVCLKFDWQLLSIMTFLSETLISEAQFGLIACRTLSYIVHVNQSTTSTPLCCHLTQIIQVIYSAANGISFAS